MARKSKRSGGGMIMRESGAAGAKKKRLVKIITLIVVAAVVVTAGLGTGIYFLSKTIKNNTFDVPRNLRVEEFDAEKGFTLLLRWDAQSKADNYTLEYEYAGLYPGEINKVTVRTPGYYLERKRGILNYRVTVNDKKGNALTSEWVSYDVPPIKLATPKNLRIIADVNGNMRISYNETIYKYYNDESSVFAYEVSQTFYYPPENEGDDYEKSTTGSDSYVTSLNAFIVQKTVDEFAEDGFGKTVVRVRAMNYRKIGNKITEEPKNLFDIYEPSEWAEAEMVFE